MTVESHANANDKTSKWATLQRKRQRRAGSQYETLNGAARFRKPWVPYLWVTVPVLVVLTFYVFPFVNTLFTSFTKSRPLRGMGEFNGIENYQYVLGDPKFWDAVLNSIVYAICVVPLMIILPLLLALLVRDHVPGIGVFRSLYYIPAICSLVVISLAWTSLLDNQGPINNMLKSIGLIEQSIPFTSNRWLLLFSAMIITLWQGLPYYMILYLSALANVDKSLYEAAEMDGAGAIRRFFTVTVPAVRVMMYLVGILSTIGCLKIFTEVYLLGGTNSPTVTITMYLRDFSDVTFGHLGRGSAASVFLFLLTLGFIIASRRLNKKAEQQ
ncbi:carbohydrate ABC transporter permease [Bowdeniella massiliensis]|uniref:carbohydrate ABC transporter permease n=1 Tax=Bowdeniella massiliensis TaxID=2932264 RepID=UPI002028D255|nr:sugar ABC transporter permease [Bowdeniella massiliensis]